MAQRWFRWGWSDDFIPVDTEAVSSETIALLQGWAKEYGLDAVVSADGDADRPLVADETGLPLRGDLVGLITSDFLGAEVAVTPSPPIPALKKAAPSKWCAPRSVRHM